MSLTKGQSLTTGRVAFESFLLDAEERREVLQEVPKEYWRVIAAAGAER